MAYLPKPKDCKDKEKNELWFDHYTKCVDRQDESGEVVMYGDSIIANYRDWSIKFSREVMNFAHPGDKIEQCLFMVTNGRIPKNVKVVVVHIGTNNVESDDESKVAAGIVQICRQIHTFRKDVDIIVSGILPGKKREVEKVNKINKHLECLLREGKGKRKRKGRRKGERIGEVHYKVPDMGDWTILNEKGKIVRNPDLYNLDGIHLLTAGYAKLISHTQDISRGTCLPFLPLNYRDYGLEENPFIDKNDVIGLSEIADLSIAGYDKGWRYE